MIELQRSPSHQALASDGSNAYQSTRQGARRMLGNAISSSGRTATGLWKSRRRRYRALIQQITTPA